MDANHSPARSADRSHHCAVRCTLLELCLLLLLAPGCTSPRQWWANGFKVGPNYCPPGAEVAESWLDASDPNVVSQPNDDACWWTVFNDPVLNELVQCAYQENLTLRLACFRIQEAQAERGIAVGTLFPQQQEMIGQYTRNKMSGATYPFGGVAMKQHYSDWAVGFDAAWELDVWGRIRRAIEAADANLDAQVASYHEVLVILQAEVAASYLQMRALEERLALAVKNVALQKETLNIVHVRYQNGLVSELDVQQAKANLAITESLIPVLDANHRKMRNRLCILLGEPPHDLDEVLGGRGTIPLAPPQVVVGIPADLLRRRPDVRRAERQAAAQCARIGIAEAEFYPHIAITGTISVQSQYLRDLFDASSMAGQIGPGFQWNILNYGRIANNVRAQDARFQQAVLELRETVLRANEETENAIVSFLREQVRVKSIGASAQAMERAVELAMRQYEQGLIDYQPLLETQRGLVQQQDTLAESRGLVAINLVAVYKALAGGWRMPETAPPPAPVAAN